VNELRAFAKQLAELGRQVRSKPRFLTGKMVERLDDFHARVDLGPKLVTAYVSLILGPALDVDQMVTVRVQDSSYVITDILTGTLAGLISAEDTGRLRQLTNGAINRWPTLADDDGTMTMSQSDMRSKAGWSFATDPGTVVDIRCELSRHEWDLECVNSGLAQSMSLWIGEGTGDFTLYGCGAGQSGVPLINIQNIDQLFVGCDIADPDGMAWSAYVGVEFYTLSGKLIRTEPPEPYATLTNSYLRTWYRIIDGIPPESPSEITGLLLSSYFQIRKQGEAVPAFARPFVRFVNTTTGYPIFFTNFECYVSNVN